jgi:hypothetical protein
MEHITRALAHGSTNKKMNLDILCHPTLFISAKITDGKYKCIVSSLTR